jgi:hypothetical protein
MAIKVQRRRLRRLVRGIQLVKARKFNPPTRGLFQTLEQKNHDLLKKLEAQLKSA